MSSLQALFAPLEEEEKEEGGPPAPPASTPLLHEPQPPSSGPQDLAPPPPPSYGTLQNLFVPLDVDEPPSLGAPAAGSQTPRSHHNRRTSFVESGEEEELVTEDLRERWDPYVDAEPLSSPPSSHSVSVTWPIPVRAASPQHGGITSIEIEPLGTTDTAVTNSPGGSRSSSSPLAVQVKQLGIDCLGGVMGFLLVLVNFLCFALVTCCVPRMRENMPAVLQMLALGTIVVGLCAMTSKIPYYLVVPDLFVCPFYIAVVRTLDSAIPQSQSDELFPTFLVVAMVMVTFFGALLVAAMKLRLLRVGDYTPFPVVQGLLAAIGVGLARSCLIVQQGAASSLGVNDFMWLCVSVGIVAVLFSLELGFHKPLGTIYIPVYFSAMLLFYVLLFLVGAGDLERGIDWADSKHAFLLSATLSEEGEGGGFNVWTADILSGAISKVNWAAAAQCTGTVFSFWVLELLKVTVQFPETLKVVGTKMSDKALEREVSLLGWATVVSGLFGSYSAIPAIAPMSVIYETFEGKTLPRTKAPNIICTACVAVVFFYGFAVVRVIPKFVFSAMLLHTAVVILWHRVVVSVQKLEWNEGLVIIIIVAVSVVTGSTMNAIACGAMCSVLLFVYQWHTLGCIKYASSGLMWRSSVERPEDQCEWLEHHGDAIQILQLQGFIFFGNAEMVLRRVETMLREDLAIQEEDLTEQGIHRTGRASLLRHSSYDADPLSFVIIDLTLVMGLDMSGLVALEETVAAVACHTTQNHSFPLMIALTGASDDVWSRIRRSGLPLLNDETATRRFDDLDAGLSWCEDDLLGRLAVAVGEDDSAQTPPPPSSLSTSSTLPTFPTASSLLFALPPPMSSSSHQGERQQQLTQQQVTQQKQKQLDMTFDVWVKISAERFKIDTAPLADLAQYTRVMKWKKGDVLLRQQHGSRIDLYGGVGGGGGGEGSMSGLRFITHGLISKKRDPSQSMTTISKNRLLKLDRQSLHANMREFRFARFGPGGVVGLEDFFTGYRSVGVFEAETDVVVHFLPYSMVEKLQTERPELIMHLLKVLGRLVTNQFNRTKERLSHVMDAMTTINTRKDNENLPSRRTMRLVRTLANRIG